MDMLISEADVRPLEAALRRAGLDVCSYDIHCDLVARDEFVRQSELARIRVGLQRAAFFGAPVVLVVPGILPHGVSVSQAQEWYADGLRSSLPAARHVGITLSIENIGMDAMAVYCGLPEHVNRIWSYADEAVAAVYDAGNFLMSGKDPLAAMRELKPPMIHTHFKDWEIVDKGHADAFAGIDGRQYLGVVLGRGVVDLRGTLAALAERSYDGYLSVEYEGPERPDVSLPPAVDYLRSLLGERATGVTAPSRE
jgi:sugar phosphate isomerase/epimerase